MSEQTGSSVGRPTRRAAPEAPPIEGYEDLVEVGRGGFGIVFRAEQVAFSRTVALKVLTGTYDDAARGRFERECRALGSLSDHPNIVTVFAAGFTSDERPYLAMELLPGGSLSERLAGATMPWEEAAAVGVKIAGALQRAHDSGVLHRDVKPENILMSAYGEPKLADFGIARLEGGYETKSGVITLTFAHAAPELLEGRPPTPASDVYALASSLYALLTGQPPFVTGDGDRDTLPALIARIATMDPPDLRGGGVPDAVCGALERALTKDPDARTPTARAFADELQAAVAGAGVSLPTVVTTGRVPAPPAGRRRAGRGAPRGLGRRAVVIGSALAGLALVAAAVIAVSLSGGGGGGTPAGRARASGAPAMPSTLRGYRKEGSPTTVTQRIFADSPNYIQNFPWTMNSCADGMNTTVWRSLVPDDIVAGGHTDAHGSTTLQISAVKQVTTGTAGLIVGDGCHEPVFFLVRSAAGDTLVDVATTTQHWVAAP
jgi:hypothetical protein